MELLSNVDNLFRAKHLYGDMFCKPQRACARFTICSATNYWQAWKQNLLAISYIAIAIILSPITTVGLICKLPEAFIIRFKNKWLLQDIEKDIKNGAKYPVKTDFIHRESFSIDEPDMTKIRLIIYQANKSFRKAFCFLKEDQRLISVGF